MPTISLPKYVSPFPNLHLPSFGATMPPSYKNKNSKYEIFNSTLNNGDRTATAVLFHLASTPPCG